MTFNIIEIKDKIFLCRDVCKVIDDTEEHHYRVAELALEKITDYETDFFDSCYEPPIYFAPLEILKKDDIAVVEWCENHGMYFD